MALIKKSPWKSGISTQTDKLTNNHVEGWNYKFVKVVGNSIPTSSSSLLLNMMLPSHYHLTRIIDDFHYFLINAIMYSVQLT